MIEKKLPARFYKYINWENKYHKNILVEERIFFASRLKLNDPFDCSIPIRYDKQTDEEILENYKNSIKRLYPNLNQIQIDQEANYCMGQPILHAKICQDTKIKDDETLNFKLGIFSLSEKNNNLLMWTHYCNSHEGICIGFNSEKMFSFLYNYFKEKTLNCALAPVVYTEIYPTILPNWPDDKRGETILLTKASLWNYEKEWRFILWGETNKEVILPEGIITEVVIGCHMPETHRNEIIEILRKKKSKIELKEAHPNSEEFKLDFTPVRY